MKDEEKDEHVAYWKDLIRQTEEMVNDWKDIEEDAPYYQQIYKSWENFIEKQKEELEYHMRRRGTSPEETEF